MQYEGFRYLHISMRPKNEKFASKEFSLWGKFLCARLQSATFTWSSHVSFFPCIPEVGLLCSWTLTLSSSYNVVWLIYFNTISLRSFRCYGDLINLVSSSSCTVWHERSTIRTINSWYELGFAKLGGIWQTKNLAVFYIQILKLKYEGFHLVLYCFAWKDTNIPECTSPQKRSRELH